jgi:hypothetical protein
MTDTDAWNTGCGMWRMRGCKLSDVNNITILGYDPTGDGKDDTVAVACHRVFGYSLGDENTEGTAMYECEGVPPEDCEATDNPCWVKCCGFV